MEVDGIAVQFDAATESVAVEIPKPVLLTREEFIAWCRAQLNLVDAPPEPFSFRLLQLPGVTKKSTTPKRATAPKKGAVRK